jgi:molecular chaperone GrpE (heat shock protein)
MVVKGLYNDINKFIEFLAYQSNLNNKSENLFKKIPFLESQLEEKSNKIEIMIEEFEDIRRRDVYGLLVQEFTEILERKG